MCALEGSVCVHFVFWDGGGGVSVHFVPWEGVRSWSCVQTGAERVAFILCFGRPPCIHFVLRRFPQAPKLTDEWLPRGLGAFIVCLGSGFCVDFVLWEVEGRGGVHVVPWEGLRSRVCVQIGEGLRSLCSLGWSLCSICGLGRWVPSCVLRRFPQAPN